MEEACLKTPLGWARIKGDSAGLHSISVMDEAPHNTDKVPDSLKVVVNQLEEYFHGNRRQFSLKLNPAGTPFQKKVWAALLETPYGKTISYLELSKRLGDVKAIRAVAAANGKNPIWIVIPCHRVIGSDGSLTGYAGGLDRKKWLLDLESPVKQQKLFSE